MTDDERDLLLGRLIDIAAAAQTANRDNDTRKNDTRSDRTRVKDELTKLSPEVLEDGVELEYLRERLPGRIEGRNMQCAILSKILRSLGWTRKRAWTEGRTGFQSRWYPPENM